MCQNKFKKNEVDFSAQVQGVNLDGVSDRLHNAYHDRFITKAGEESDEK